MVTLGLPPRAWTQQTLLVHRDLQLREVRIGCPVAEHHFERVATVDSEWTLPPNPGESAWTTVKRLVQSRSPTSNARGVFTLHGRVLDFLQGVVCNLVPPPSDSKHHDSAPSTASGESKRPSGQGKLSKSPWHPSNIIFATDFDCTCTLVDTCKILVRAAELAALKRPERDSLLLWQPGNFYRDYKAAIRRHVERTRATVQTIFLEHKDGDSNEGLCPGLEGPQKGNSKEGLGPGSEGPQNSKEGRCSGSEGPQNSNESPSRALVALRPALEPLRGSYREVELRMALTKLAMLEVMCNQDVVSLGVLRGPTRDEIREESAGRVRLRAHCARILQRLAESGAAIHVVSANWSRDLILAGLQNLPEGKVSVHSNDLVFDCRGRSVGDIDGKVVDAFDKEDVLRGLRGCKRRIRSLVRWPSNSGERVEGTDEPILVFLGDSHTDLLGLLEADLGVVIGESLLMRRIMALFRIQLRPLAEASARISAARAAGSKLSYRNSGLLFASGGWSDVEACLFGDGGPHVQQQHWPPISTRGRN